MPMVSSCSAVTVTSERSWGTTIWPTVLRPELRISSRPARVMASTSSLNLPPLATSRIARSREKFCFFSSRTLMELTFLLTASWPAWRSLMERFMPSTSFFRASNSALRSSVFLFFSSIESELELELEFVSCSFSCSCSIIPLRRAPSSTAARESTLVCGYAGWMTTLTS